MTTLFEHISTKHSTSLLHQSLDNKFQQNVCNGESKPKTKAFNCNLKGIYYFTSHPLQTRANKNKSAFIHVTFTTRNIPPLSMRLNETVIPSKVDDRYLGMLID